MNTRKSLAITLCALAVLICGGILPTLAYDGGGISNGPPPQIKAADLTIPLISAGYSWENVEWIYVANQGNTTAPASTLGVVWNKGRFSKLYTFSVKSLTVGEGTWIKVELDWSHKQTDPGTHMQYIADYYKTVFESNENNNEADLDY